MDWRQLIWLARWLVRAPRGGSVVARNAAASVRTRMNTAYRETLNASDMFSIVFVPVIVNDFANISGTRGWTSDRRIRMRRPALLYRSLRCSLRCIKVSAHVHSRSHLYRAYFSLRGDSWRENYTNTKLYPGRSIWLTIYFVIFFCNPFCIILNSGESRIRLRILKRDDNYESEQIH